VTPAELQSIVAELVTKPRHEKVRALLHRLLTDALGADSRAIDFERRLPEVHGRIDALLGRTVFEIKSDLVRERAEAERQLLDYLPQRERETGQKFVGIATDGADFRVYIVRDGELDELAQFRPKATEPAGLIAWLESVVVVTDEIPPDVQSVQRELGRESVAYLRALREIEAYWNDVSDHPEAKLKRELWSGLVRVAYGGDIDAPKLFYQHTYLTTVAKAIATVALLDTLPATGASLLEGKAFRDIRIIGAVESDFFDWILLHPKGAGLVMEIARHANRFRLRDIEVDILKGLYESLIDPDQRHDLGEYYTPDWLADRICKAAIRDPLRERVIDPACGSGTFLFHAIRRLLSAAEEQKIAPAPAVVVAIEKVAGIDIHPVAVIFSRVTYLLALMPTLQRGRPGSISIPVYLGDALQWNARRLVSLEELEIVVPGTHEQVRTDNGTLPNEDEFGRVILRFPFDIASNPGLFDSALDEMLSLAGRDQPVSAFSGWLARHGIAAEAEADILRGTYESLRRLQRQDRNHIWGYVARNLSRPIWLATEAQKADVVLGNPPWLDYRAMNAATQVRFREEMKAVGLWQAKTHGAAFDLSAYFFARAVYLYMRRSGRIAFVMPYASMTRNSYRPFRAGRFKKPEYLPVYVRFFDAWAFPADVQPLFPVPSCVLFAERSDEAAALPQSIHIYSGHLPRRDAHANEANKNLAERLGPWPTDERPEGSAYREKFRAGAKLDPHRLILVERVVAGRLGASPDAPLVRGRVGTLDKKPWKYVDPPQAAVEARFLRSVYLGESIGPYRLFEPVLAVIPWDDDSAELLTSERAGQRGYPRLSSWLSTTERLWEEHGKGKTSFAEKMDFYGLLSAQFPIAARRVVYSASGTNPAAATIVDRIAVIDHKLYWAAVQTQDEGRYLVAVLNSETVRARAERWQSRGQWGARDFDKVAFNLPVPIYDGNAALHRALASAAARAERVAAMVEFPEGEHFTRTRGRIRDALRADGIAGETEKLVAQLLL